MTLRSVTLTYYNGLVHFRVSYRLCSDWLLLTNTRLAAEKSPTEVITKDFTECVLMKGRIGWPISASENGFFKVDNDKKSHGVSEAPSEMAAGF